MNENKQIDNNNIHPDVDGLDSPELMGWGDYPLDSVFVRKEQRTVSEVVKRIKNDRFILHPDFQRDYVWPPKKQSRLIESCLMRIPLPVFYVAEAKDGRIIVVDGLQRLVTFTRFMNNEFALTKLGDGREANPQENKLIGKRFNDLPLNLKERIEDTQLTLYILDSKAPDRAKLDIFERVNSGEPLARQQMRNCLFNGPATKWLADAADSEHFLNATGRSLNKKTMRDREAINRFCAFSLLGIEKYKGEMDDFLARTLEKMNNMKESELVTMMHGFEESMIINHKLFNKHAFRKSIEIDSDHAKHSAKSVINIALFDVCSVLFKRVDLELVERNIELFRKAIRDLLKRQDFYDAISYATNGIRQVNTRFSMMEEAIEEVTSQC